MIPPSNPAPRVPSVKLSPPVVPATHVIRQHVGDMLRHAASAKLVIVRAPAGFGKTTAMLQYRAELEAASVATAWLTLDSADNDPARFLSGFEAALAAIIRDEAFPDSGQPVSDTIGQVALWTMNRLASHPGPFALFVDDFEVVQEPSVIAWMREIIDHLPHNGRLVIGTRGLPDFRLGRLRARGQLLEIGVSALRFSIEETAQFFRTARPISLSADDLLRLHRKTEGWVAALWLASASLEHSDTHADFIDHFSGTNRSIAEYLTEDVVARQPGTIRRFLLHTSILRYLSAPLCRALIADMDCEAILYQLEAAGLVTSIESEDRTWRYHSLIADFLKAQLKREAPAELPALHRLAADWYESQRRPVPAIDHALEAGDFDRVVEYLNEHGYVLLGQGRMRLLTRWFDALPEDVLGSHLPLQAIRIWALAFTRGPWEAMDLLDRSGLQETGDPAVRPHVLALRPTLLGMMDRFEEALDVGLECLAEWPTGLVLADMMLSNAMANAFVVQGRPAEARRLLEAARGAQGADVSAFNLMYSETIEAIFDLQQGRLREATARLRIAIGSGGRHLAGYTGGNAWAGVMYAAAVYELNDLAQAEHLLRVYLPLARNVLLPDHVILGHTMLSRIAFERGDVDGAFEVLTQLEYMGNVRRLGRMIASAKLERARVLLMQGHARAAREEMARAEDPSMWGEIDRLHLVGNDLDYLTLAQLRWDALAGDAATAARRLREAVDRADNEGRHRRAMKLRLLCALAYQREGDPVAAHAVMKVLLKATCMEGYVRLLLDEGGRHVGPLLRQFSRISDAGDASSRDGGLADYVSRLIQACGDFDEGAYRSADASLQLLEPLTPKEIRVLRLLAEGYSNNAIAEKLFVTDSTVRTHLRNINTKVRARSRTQAVAIARRLGVIT